MITISTVANGFILREENGYGLFARQTTAVFTDKGALLTAVEEKIDKEVADLTLTQAGQVSSEEQPVSEEKAPVQESEQESAAAGGA